ncbi:MAG: DUF86 domain-containing protein [Parcubacteria group bacterium]|nr:DUF86 domain-containing protein [Parcubacteria group bacterium]
MKDYNLTLELILEAAQKISDYLANFSFADFSDDSKTQSAVIMQLIVIGELTKKLPDEVKQLIELPWRLMAGFRDLAVHEYFKLDLAKVWETVSKDVPLVKEKLELYLRPPA